MNRSNHKKSLYSSHMSNKSKGLLVTTLILLETMCHKTSLVALKRAIRARHDLVHPLLGDGGNTRLQRNKIPSASTLQGSDLLNHSMQPLLLKSVFSIVQEGVRRFLGGDAWPRA